MFAETYTICLINERYARRVRRVQRSIIPVLSHYEAEVRSVAGLGILVMDVDGTHITLAAVQQELRDRR